MRNFYFVFMVSLLLIGACQSAQETATTVFLVRHAEKDTNTNAEDPLLTTKGQMRAARLWENLDVDTVHALYSTDYERTRATLVPLSEQFNLPIITYEAHDFAGLAADLLSKYDGQKVVVSGHSNTVLPIIEALGATPPVDSIGELDYNYIFTVEIPSQGNARASVKEYQPL